MLKSGTGIVLKRWKEGEADTVIQLLDATGQSTLVRLHGIRKSIRRSQLLTEPGSLISYTLYTKPDDPTRASLKEGSVLNRFEHLKDTYEKMVWLSELLETTRLAVIGPEEAGLFRLLKSALDNREQFYTSVSTETGLNQSAFSVFFTIRLLDLLGWVADTTRCNRCSAPLSERAFWIADEIAFLCTACSTEAGQRDAKFAAWIASARTEKFTPFFERLDPAESETVTELERNLKRLVTLFFGRTKKGPQ